MAWPATSELYARGMGISVSSGLLTPCVRGSEKAHLDTRETRLHVNTDRGTGVASATSPAYLSTPFFFLGCFGPA